VRDKLLISENHTYSYLQEPILGYQKKTQKTVSIM